MPRLAVQVNSFAYEGDGQPYQFISHGMSVPPGMVWIFPESASAGMGTSANAPWGMHHSFGSAQFSNALLALRGQGMYVGNAAQANAAGVKYHALFVGGTEAQRAFKSFSYVGNGANPGRVVPDSASINPAAMWVYTAGQQVWMRTSYDPDGDWSVSMLANGATPGRLGPLYSGTAYNNVSVNGLNLRYYGEAFAKTPGFFDTGTYVGDGVGGRVIEHGLGRQPAAIFVKSHSFVAASRIHLHSMGSNFSASGSGGTPSSTVLYGVNDSTFTISASTSVNRIGHRFLWMAIGAGSLRGKSLMPWHDDKL